jgi:hypothetical protein
VIRGGRSLCATSDTIGELDTRSALSHWALSECRGGDWLTRWGDSRSLLFVLVTMAGKER